VVLPKRDEAGKLPPEVAAESTSGSNGRQHTPQAALGPAVAGTDPHRGLTHGDSGTATDRDNEA
jgi:hypothetical protein